VPAIGEGRVAGFGTHYVDTVGPGLGRSASGVRREADTSSRDLGGGSGSVAAKMTFPQEPSASIAIDAPLEAVDDAAGLSAPLT